MLYVLVMFRLTSDGVWQLEFFLEYVIEHLEVRTPVVIYSATNTVQ